jgi:RHS repeat-associated protein
LRVTNGSGAVVQALDYYPYGATRVDTKSGGYGGEKCKYAGTESDTVSGLNYMMARYQSPTRGQFVSEDPTFWSQRQNLENPQSLNSYSYANDNPINLSDPNGLAATVTQKIQVLQAQVAILQGIVGLYQSGSTQQANTAFAACQTAFGVSGQWNGSIANSRPNPTGGTMQVPNITSQLNRDMQAHASDSRVGNPLYFRDKVKSGGDWDLKNTPQYSSKIIRSGLFIAAKPSDLMHLEIFITDMLAPRRGGTSYLAPVHNYFFSKLEQYKLKVSHNGRTQTSMETIRWIR